jgi:hypothetical protein
MAIAELQEGEISAHPNQHHIGLVWSTTEDARQLSVSTLDFVTETLKQIGYPQPVDGADFNN